MISTFFLSIFYGFVSLIVGFLPTGSLPAGVSTAVSYFWGVMQTFSYLIPLDTVLQAVILVFAFEFALLLWSFLNWIIRKIPGMQ